MINIVLFGKPGTKSTQAEFLKKNINFHISTGDVFFNKNDTDLGKQARVYMDAGDLVPDELTTKMLIDEVNKHRYDGILFDGYQERFHKRCFRCVYDIDSSKVTATIALE
jgi:adenylate kinase